MGTLFEALSHLSNHGQICPFSFIPPRTSKEAFKLSVVEGGSQRCFEELCIDVLFYSLQRAIQVASKYSAHPDNVDEAIRLVRCLDAMCEEACGCTSAHGHESFFPVISTTFVEPVNVLREGAAYWISLLSPQNSCPTSKSKLFRRVDRSFLRERVSIVLIQRVVQGALQCLSELRSISLPRNVVVSFCLGSIAFDVESVQSTISPTKKNVALLEVTEKRNLLEPIGQRLSWKQPLFGFYIAGSLLTGLLFLAGSLALAFDQDLAETNRDRTSAPEMEALCYLEAFIDSQFCTRVLFDNHRINIDDRMPDSTEDFVSKTPQTQSLGETPYLPLRLLASCFGWWILLLARWCRGRPLGRLDQSGPPAKSVRETLFSQNVESEELLRTSVYRNYLGARKGYFSVWCHSSIGEETSISDMDEDVPILVGRLSETLWRALLPFEEVKSPSRVDLPFVLCLLHGVLALYRGHRHLLENFLPLENELTLRVIPWIESLAREQALNSDVYVELLLGLREPVQRLQRNLQSLIVTPQTTPLLMGMALGC